MTGIAFLQRGPRIALGQPLGFGGGKGNIAADIAAIAALLKTDAVMFQPT